MPAAPGQTTDDCATVWFAILERAKNRNDFERAAEAQRKLRDLGVEVRFVAGEGRQGDTQHSR